MALRGDAYAGVKKNAELQKVKLRAEVIINVERGMSDADRRNPEWFPHYVQTLELLPSREPHHFKEGTDSAQLDRRLTDLEATVQKNSEEILALLRELTAKK